MKTTKIKKKTIDRLTQKLHEELISHPHKDEIIKLALTQLADDSSPLYFLIHTRV